ncbi:MAG: PAS domain S-box protein [Calditrichaeota bacterium]|nr:PAS domain S-box protein [Calditrichota bacterium]
MTYQKFPNLFPHFLNKRFVFPLTVGIIFVLLGFISFLNLKIYRTNQKQLIQEFQQEQQTIARAIGTNLSNTFNSIYKELGFYALDPRIQSSDYDKLQPALKSLYSALAPSVKSISRMDSNGVLVAVFPPNPASIGRNISNQPHVRYILAQHKFVISKPIQAIQGYKAIIMHVPVFRKKNAQAIFSGSLAALIPVEFLPDLFHKLITSNDQNDHIFVVDKDGTIISHNNRDFIGKNLLSITGITVSKDSLARAFQAHHEIALFQKFPFFRNSFVAGQDIKIGRFNYRLFIVGPRSELSRPLKQAYARQLLLWIISLIVILLLSLIIIRSYRRWTEDLNNELDSRTQSILESERRFRDLFTEALEGIYQSTLDGKFIQVNPAFAKMLGYTSPDELMNIAIAEGIYLHLEDRKAFVQKLTKEGSVHNFESVLKRKDGSLLFALESARLLTFPDGSQFIQGSILDITKRVSYEDQLKHNHVFLSRLITYSKDINQEISLEGIFDKVTQALTENFSFPFAWIAARDLENKKIHIHSWNGGGEKLIRLLLNDDNLSECLEKILVSCIHNKVPLTIQDFETCFCKRHQKAARELGYKSAIFLPIIIKKHLPLGFIALYTTKNEGFSDEDLAYLQTFLSLTNISIERALYFAEIKESEQKYATLVEHASDGITIVQDGVFKFVNPQLARMLGYKQEEILNQPFIPFVSPESLPTVSKFYKSRMAGKPAPPVYTVKAVHKDGREIPIEISVSQITYNGRIALLDIIRDLSFREKAEQSLKESESRYRHLFESALIGISQFFPDGSFLTANPTLIHMLGYSNDDELLRMNFRQLLKNPDEFDDLLKKLKKSGRITNFEATFKCRDQSEIIVQSNFRVEFGENKEWRYIEGIHQNISEWKRLEQQLLQAQKMESIGILAGGIAHDFNNILTGIIGSANFMLEDLSPDHPSYEDARQIVELGERAARLIHQLLTFSRKNNVTKEILNLNHFVKESIKLFQRTFRENISFQITTHPVSHILANPEQIHQILLNLSINARDAMPQGGTISIETKPITISEAYQAFHTYAQPGNYVLLSVSDTGTGIPKKFIDKIFDPFFTTKKLGKGTGLGLSVVYGIVKSHNGFIHVYSDPKQGTTFKIYFPAIQEEKQKTAPEKTKNHVSGNERILFVEDEDFVRKTAIRILGSKGYTVIPATDGVEALTIFQEKMEQIDLVISDVVMPQMSGPQLIQEILRLKPSQKFFFVSGYSAGQITFENYSGKIDVVPKPFDSEEFLQKVRDSLDSNGVHHLQSDRVVASPH